MLKLSSSFYYFLLFPELTKDQPEVVSPLCALSPVCLDSGNERCCSRSFISSAQISGSLFLGSRLFTLEREGQCQNSSARTISLRLKSLVSIQTQRERILCCQAIEFLSHLLNPCETVSLMNCILSELNLISADIFDLMGLIASHAYSFQISARFATL